MCLWFHLHPSEQNNNGSKKENQRTKLAENTEKHKTTTRSAQRHKKTWKIIHFSVSATNKIVIIHKSNRIAVHSNCFLCFHACDGYHIIQILGVYNFVRRRRQKTSKNSHRASANTPYTPQKMRWSCRLVDLLHCIQTDDKKGRRRMCVFVYHVSAVACNVMLVALAQK